MRTLNDLVERAPMVWLLLGLLIISGGLYLGFESSLVFVYLFVGGFCSVYGLVLFIFLFLCLLVHLAWKRKKRKGGSLPHG